jgi:S-adenosylmethionine/arginine decarboxylase-like enzyme
VENASRLNDPSYVQGFLERLIRDIGMTIIGGPSVVRVPVDASLVDQPHHDDGGLTVQYVISTSHVTFHSWPAQRRFRLVVDSCQNFSVSRVLAMVRAYFPVKGNSVQDIPYLAPEDCHGQETTHAQAQAG